MLALTYFFAHATFSRKERSLFYCRGALVVARNRNAGLLPFFKKTVTLVAMMLYLSH
jgi:hypothetical protein